mgnify:FL=1
MKKFLTVLLSSTFLLNTLNAEEMPVLENDNEVKTVVEENTQTDETTTQIENTPNEEQEVKNYVAQINETKYETFDEALAASKNDDTIILLSNATTEGINLKHNLTIDGKKYTLTFTNKGIAMWKYSLTFKNMTVSMNGITSTPYTAEWNWMAIASSTDAKLILENTNMTIDAAGKSKNNTHAIYFCGNNVLSLKNSNLTIKNYKQDALEWNGDIPGFKEFDTGYNIILENSTFVSDHNRSGFTGTFTVKTYNSNVDVINSSGNGSNGSHFEFYDSKVNFNNNGAHGLSAGLLTINNSTVNANNNGANGIHVKSTLKIQNNSIVNIENNKCSISSQWTIPGALYVAGKNSIIDKTTKLTIQNNNGSGIYVHKTGDLKLEAGTIINNFAEKLQIGGGIHNAGNLIIDDSVIINNNHAEISSDDIYNDENANITFGNTHDDWELNGGYKDKDKTEKDCTDKIDGWYDDNEEKRYNSHDENKDNLYVLEKASGNYTNKLTLKAAHGLYGNVTVRYIDDEGKELSENIILRGKVDNEYTSSEKEFEYYELIEVKGNKTGKYTLDNQEVIYIYSFVGGMGGDIVDPAFPKTGVEDSNLPEVIFSLSSLLLVGTILLKKKFSY